MDTDTSDISKSADTSNRADLGQSVQSSVCSKHILTKRSLIENTSTSGQDSNICLEDLLAIKQAEKPDARFWQNFEEQLEERTLRACMREEPWYRTPMGAPLSSALSAALSSAFSFASARREPVSGRSLFKIPSLARSMTSVFACGLIAWIGLALIVDKQSFKNPASWDANKDILIVESTAVPSHGLVAPSDGKNDDYLLMEIDGLASVEQDFAVEIITIKSRTESTDFAADAIPIVIGDSVDYSDSAVHSSEALNRLNARSINPYTQLASFAF